VHVYILAEAVASIIDIDSYKESNSQLYSNYYTNSDMQNKTSHIQS